jgi:hypothetical protein
MSIAQLRAFSPHYFVVALLLSIVAVTAFSMTQADAAAGDTSVTATGGVVVLTPSQTTLLTATADAVPASAVHTGVLSITAGSLISNNSGILATPVTYIATVGVTAVNAPPVQFFPSAFVGAVTAKTTDHTSAVQPGVDTGLALTIVGAPVFTLNLQATGGDPAVLAAIPSITTNALANVDYNQDADVYVSISDANGTAYPNAIVVTLTVDNLALAAIGTAGLAFTATQATAADDVTVGGVAARNGVAAFVDGGGADEGITAKILGVRGTLTVTATIPEGSGTLAVPVTGPVASISTTLHDVTNVDTDGSNNLTVVTYAAAAPNALGTIAPAFNPDVINNTTLAVQVTAFDADGTIVNVLPAAAAPTIVDTNTTAALRLVTGGTAMGDFGVAGSQGVATSVGAGKAFGLLVGGGTAAEGLHTVRGSFTPTGLVALTSDVTIRQGGIPAAIAFTVANAQSAHSINSDGLGVITATVTSADGGIVGDRTPVTVVAPAAFGVAYQGANPAGTVNGVATITTLPLSVTANLTFTMTSGLIVKTFQVSFGANASSLPAAVAVTSVLTALDVGAATTVTAAVTLTGGAAAAGVTGIWSEGTSVASVPSNVTTTDAAGNASITFLGDEAGVRTVTFTVVNLVGGVVVETATKGSVDITVTAVAVAEPEPEPVVEPVSGVAGLTFTTGYSAYIGGADATASELFAGLTDATILWNWHGGEWIFYATLSSGAELPGSTNFNATLGSILFIGA